MADSIDDYSQDPTVQGRLHTALQGMDSLIQAAEQDHAEITEATFKKVLLPVLTNRSGKQSLRIWNDIAGHPMRAIKVVDTKTKERLFVIPPLMRGVLPSIPNNQRRMSIYEILQVADQKRQIIANMGERFLVEQMRAWEPVGSSNDETLKQWAAILKRYGVDIGVTAEEEPTEQKESPSIDLTGEYDDL